MESYLYLIFSFRVAVPLSVFAQFGLYAKTRSSGAFNSRNSVNISRVLVQKCLVAIYKNISQRRQSSFRFNRVMNEANIDSAIISALRKKKNNKDNPYSDLNKETVVIHGIHQFSPAMLCAIEDISKHKNVLLLFNYQEQYSQIYQTWQE